MNILILKLCAVFLVIIAMLWRKLPLFAAISGAWQPRCSCTEFPWAGP